MSTLELDQYLGKFYAEARSQKGDEYSRSTLLGLRNSIERFLNNPPYKRGIRITGNPDFQMSNRMLDAKLKKLKKEGKENTLHKPAMNPQDLQRLKESTVLHTSNPLRAAP